MKLERFTILKSNFSGAAAWFGRRADGTGIISQTRDACEKRLAE
jgi:hypothetical protein